MADNDYNVYRYKRGEFSVDIIVSNKDTLHYYNVKVPLTSSREVKEKFFADAEKAALEEMEKAYVSGV